MDLETFRAIDVDIDLANDFVPDVILSANDYNGRCIVARVTNGGVSVNGDNLSARLLFNAAPGISAGGYVTMTRVASSPTATWQAPVPSDALAARQVMLCVQIVDSDDNLVCSRNFRGIVDRKLMDDDAPESVNELNQLWEGIDALENIDASVTADGTVSVTAPDGTVTTSTAVPAAVSAANSATSAANTAATAANTAATAANTAADAANDAAARAETAAKPTEEMFASYHALLRAGASEGIASDANPVQSSFLRRVSGSAEGVRDGVATIECVRGNTVGWNQLVSMPWCRNETRAGVTFASQADGSVRASGTAESNVYQQTLANQSAVKTIVGHKYLAKKIGTAADKVWLYNDNSGIMASETENAVIGTATAEKSFYVRIAGGVTIDGTIVIQVHDLTAMFGAGNEPSTVEEFEALYPLPYYAYDPGTLKPVMFEGIETVGFNQWDEEMEPGIIFSTTGLPSTSGYAEYRRSKNYMPVFPSTVYSVTSPNTYCNIVFYDADKNPIYLTGANSYQWGLGDRQSFTTPSSARYIRFTTKANYVYDGTIAIHLKWSGYRDGEYEEYWKAQRAIDVAQYFPTGMWSIGNNADMLYKDRADRMFGSVDLGTLTWAKHDTSYGCYFNAPFSDAKMNAGVKLPGYTAVYSATAFNNNDKSVAAANYKSIGINIRDSAYNDYTAEQFKAAMVGKILCYTLATPTTEPIDPPLNLGYKVSDFGTERVMLGDGVISAPPVFDIAYGYTAESLRDAAASIVAPVENHLAQDNYAIGSYLVRNGVLYKVTAAIARNESIIPGTNVTATTVMAEIASING